MAQTVAIRVVVQDMERAIADFRKLGPVGEAELQRIVEKANAAGPAMGRMSQGMDKVGQSSGQMRANTANVTAQLQDMVVQLQAGTQWTTVMAQQLPQMTAGMGGVAMVGGLALGVLAGLTGVLIAAHQGTVDWGDALRLTANEVGMTEDQITRMTASVARNASESSVAMEEAAKVMVIAGVATADNFERLLETTAGLADLMDGDLAGAAELVAKVMENPKNATDALSDAGIRFSAVVNDEIARLAELGDEAGASALILDELARRVGSGEGDSGTFVGALWSATKASGAFLASLVSTASQFVPFELSIQAGIDRLKDYAKVAREAAEIVKYGGLVGGNVLTSEAAARAATQAEIAAAKERLAGLRQVFGEETRIVREQRETLRRLEEKALVENLSAEARVFEERRVLREGERSRLLAQDADLAAKIEKIREDADKELARNAAPAERVAAIRKAGEEELKAFDEMRSRLSAAKQAADKADLDRLREDIRKGVENRVRDVLRPGEAAAARDAKRLAKEAERAAAYPAELARELAQAKELLEYARQGNAAYEERKRRIDAVNEAISRGLKEGSPEFDRYIAQGEEKRALEDKAKNLMKTAEVMEDVTRASAKYAVVTGEMSAEDAKAAQRAAERADAIQGFVDRLDPATEGLEDYVATIRLEIGAAIDAKHAQEDLNEALAETARLSKAASGINKRYGGEGEGFKEALDKLNAIKGDPNAKQVGPRAEENYLIDSYMGDLENSMQALDGLKLALFDFWKENGNAAKSSFEVAQFAMDGMADSLVEFVTTGKTDIKSLARSIMVELADKAIRYAIAAFLKMAIMRMIAMGISAASGNPAAGMSTGTFSDQGMAGADWEAVPVQHRGGVVGRDGGITRAMDPRLWEHAERYHAGGLVGPRLRQGERAIIAEDGERVIPKGGAAGGTYVTENHWYIDARGATSPMETERTVQRGAERGAAMMMDRQQRDPQGRRRFGRGR